MRSMLIEAMGQRLSHKPLEWQSWWWGIKWSTFIGIYPQLTEEHPLWQRKDSHLENIRLCGLRPNELQAEIAMYWEKSFWRRWLLSFFTDIDSKIVIWSYYKRCLSFRIIQKENPALEQRLMVYDPEQRFVNLLIHQLKKDNAVLEDRLERHSGNAQWVEKNLGVLLAQHEKKRQRFFLKLLNKHLKELPAECDQDSVRKKLEEEYQALEKMLRKYVEKACQVNVSQPSSIQQPIIEENPNRDLVYVGPAVVAERTLSPYVETDPSCSMSGINEWLTLKRQTIRELLKEEPASYEAIQTVLEDSLKSLQAFIEPQLKGYENVVNEARYRRVNHKEALAWSEHLQGQLRYFFRNSRLLFHPDKSEGDENIRLIKTELFKEFEQFFKSSLERFDKGFRILKRCIPQWELDLDERLKKEALNIRERREWFDRRYAALEKRDARIAERLTVMQEQLNTLLRPNTLNSEAISDPYPSSSQDESSMQAREFFRPNLTSGNSTPEHQEESPLELRSSLTRP